MTYRISGLEPAAFADTDALLRAGAVRVQADSKPGFPCRVTLEDAEPGESLLLLNHVSHDVATPFRSAYAMYVREGATKAHGNTIACGERVVQVNGPRSW